MDAKSRANFINSVGAGKKIPCPSCNTLNDPDSKFCMICGTKLSSIGDLAGQNEIPAGAGVPDPVQAEVPFAPAEKEEPVQPAEPQGRSAFAPVDEAADGGFVPVDQEKKPQGRSAFAPAEPVAGTDSAPVSQEEKSPAFTPLIKPRGRKAAFTERPVEPEPVREEPVQPPQPVFQQTQVMVQEEEEPISVFAQGLPEWDMVPPQIMVRRKKKR